MRTVIVVVRGGLVSELYTRDTLPLRVVVLDFDLEDASRFTTVGSEDAGKMSQDVLDLLWANRESLGE